MPLTTLARNLRLYWRLQLLHLRAFLEYEADFWIGILAMFLRHGAGIAFIWVLFGRVPEVAGWTKWEMLFLYSLLLIPRGSVELLGNGQYRLGDLVHGGEFDRLLLRPYSPVLQVFSYTAAIHGLGSVLLGIVVLTTASANLGIVWTPPHALLLIATLVSSAVLIASVSLATNSICFWGAGETGAFPNFVNNLVELAKFPVSIYGMLVQTFLTFVLPFAFITYYPAMALLGRQADAAAAFPVWLAYVSPLAGPAVALVVSLIWRRGLARYQGVGN
jgi:ABC-2 type transport system permease protein